MEVAEVPVATKTSEGGLPSIPEIKFSPHAPIEKIEKNGGMEILKKQWGRFWALRRRPEPIREAGMVPTIPKGALLHNLHYDAEAIKTILESGVMSGEIGYQDKTTVEEDSETHFCADFFRNVGEDKPVQEYFKEAVTTSSTGPLRRKPMESYRAPTIGVDNISIVINGCQSELAELLQNSGDGEGFSTNPQNNPLSQFINGFPREGSNKHVAVLIGVPANFIDKIVIGESIEKDSGRLSQLKGLIATAGLHTPVVSVTGTLL